MRAIWFSACKTQEDKDKLRAKLIANREVLDLLSKMVESKKKSPKESDYDKAAWPYYRADLDGYNRALEDIIGLLNLDQKEN